MSRFTQKIEIIDRKHPTMDFLKRLFGGKPANSAPPAVPNTGATAPVLPASSTNATATVGGKRRSRRDRKQTRRNNRKSRKNTRK